MESEEFERIVKERLKRDEELRAFLANKARKSQRFVDSYSSSSNLSLNESRSSTKQDTHSNNPK